MRPLKMIAIGFVLILLGVVVPFLMVMKVLESTFLLNFLAYAASITGLFLGFLGATAFVGRDLR